MTHTRRATLIVTATDQGATNLKAATIDPDTGGDKTFSIPLSDSGSNPPTHYAAFGTFTPTTLAQIEGLVQTDFPNGKVYRGYCEHDTEPGILRFTFEEAIADMGLQRIE